MRGIRFVALAWVIFAALVAPAALWADGQPDAPGAPAATTPAAPAAPADPSAATTSPAPPPADPALAPAAPTVAAAPPPADAAVPDGKAVASKEGASAAVPIATAAASTTVTISDFEFTPATINITVGDKVVWKNDGPTQHTATSDEGMWDTGLLDKGASGSYTFEEGGTYSYICTPHPFMKGKVVVAAASSDSGTDTTGSGSADSTSAPTFSDSSGTVVDSTSSGDSSGSLASTGSDSALIALAGLLLLAGGVGLRRRLAGPSD